MRGFATTCPCLLLILFPLLMAPAFAAPNPAPRADGSVSTSLLPHGRLHRHSYTSKILGEPREVLVYTPPGYDPVSSRAYPVLVLLHGVMGQPEDWITGVQAGRGLDELIAKHEAESMILVLPLGYGFPNAAKDASRVFGATPLQQRQWMDALGRSLFEEILPFVEGAYRVRSDRDGRALAGFSMGGAQAVYLGLKYPDRVGWIGAFAGAFILFGNRLDLALPSTASRPRLLWLACGTEDPLLGPNRAAASWLDTPLQEGAGGHTDSACRQQFLAFIPQLFRSN